MSKTEGLRIVHSWRSIASGFLIIHATVMTVYPELPTYK